MPRLVPIAAPEATNYPLTLSVTMTDELRLRLIYQLIALCADVRAVRRPTSWPSFGRWHNSRVSTLAELMSRLPQTSRGQSGRARGEQRSRFGVAYVAPTTEKERAVASLWQELFGVERVSLDDNFFDLGGHSLLLVQAHSQLSASVAASTCRSSRCCSIRPSARWRAIWPAPASATLQPAAAMERAAEAT